ncbi:hypothetical protein CEXT_331651 [Caerostris extrusa]|uniref:Uncharacterized protein n=1 Tax=Caerostris extrusa TaxID=172846 RepID=A0AAV4PDX6_CAEEX|nr:hypothetical protein CEXT_331651 [Caerostris extrusa]
MIFGEGRKTDLLIPSPSSFIGSKSIVVYHRDNPIPCTSFWAALLTDNPFQISLPCVSHHSIRDLGRGVPEKKTVNGFRICTAGTKFRSPLEEIRS